MAEEVTVYDELPYNDRAFPQTHPDRLAVVGRLHGLSPAPPDRCSVLELGCGCGGNLLPMAASLPASRFLGIDLSSRQIEQGRGLVERLGLANVELRRQDLMDFALDEGPFDYVICHGVYSWVPPAVQERIRTICRRCLRPAGLATISYNVHPGWRQRDAVRDILRYGARGAGSPTGHVKQALAFLAFVAGSLFEPDSPYGRIVRAAADSLPREAPTYVFHEYLEEHNRAVSFEEFARLAGESGLRYIAEAGLRDPSSRLTDEARRHLTGIADDLVQCEQTLDLLRCATFRRDVLCLQEARPSRWPDPAAMMEMLLVAGAEAVAPNDADGARRYRNARGEMLTTADPHLQAALDLLHRARPAAVPGREVIAAAGPHAADADALARSLLACATASLVKLHTYLPPTAVVPPERPEASRVARWQAETGRLVVNLHHQSAELDDLSRQVLALLDGQRSRQDVCAALAGRPSPIAPNELPRVVDEILRALARLCLLRAPDP